MKTFEIINVDTNEVLDVVEQTQEYADQANKDYRALDIPKRWIEQRPKPHPMCRCGAEERFECVCDFDDTPSIDIDLHY